MVFKRFRDVPAEKTKPPYRNVFDSKMNGTALFLVDGNEYPKNGSFGVVVPCRGDLKLPKMTASLYKGVREDVFRGANPKLIGIVQSLQSKLASGNASWPHAKLSEDGSRLQPGSVVMLDYSGMPFRFPTQRLLLAAMLTGSYDKHENSLVLQATAEKCLMVARREKFESISFPIEVPRHGEVKFEDKAMAFCHAAWNFLRSSNPESNPVKSITLYMHNVYPDNLVEVAKQYFRNFFPQGKP